MKTGLVLAGYAAAVLAAMAAVAVRLSNTQGPDADASAGMYAFGDGLLFLAVFGAVSLVPTGMALYFLRPYRWFWVALSVAAMVLAATGVAAGVVLLFTANEPLGSPWQYWAALAFLRMLPGPLLATSFLLGAAIAPRGWWRWALLAATALEGMVLFCAFVQWLLAMC